MDLLNHDLVHEFPEQVEEVRALKGFDDYFSKLFNGYDEVNHAIRNYEPGAAVISDDALEVLKKTRLSIKDQIYQRLLQD